MEMLLSFRDVEGGNAQGPEEYDGSMTDGKCTTWLHIPGEYSRRDAAFWVQLWMGQLGLVQKQEWVLVCSRGRLLSYKNLS